MPFTSDSQYVSWGTLLMENCNSLFQTALLLSADPDVAEASVAATIKAIDLRLPPGQDELLNLQRTVASETLERLDNISAGHLPAAEAMLQAGLRPLLQVDQFPRIYFVLRVLLRLAVSSSAEMLGMEEAHAQALLQTALRQLCQASQQSNCEMRTLAR
jgi:hypothetical protein